VAAARLRLLGSSALGPRERWPDTGGPTAQAKCGAQVIAEPLGVQKAISTGRGPPRGGDRGDASSLEATVESRHILIQSSADSFPCRIQRKMAALWFEIYR
jgi:hypothetical protein